LTILELFVIILRLSANIIQVEKVEGISRYKLTTWNPSLWMTKWRFLSCQKPNIFLFYIKALTVIMGR